MKLLITLELEPGDQPGELLTRLGQAFTVPGLAPLGQAVAETTAPPPPPEKIYQESVAEEQTVTNDESTPEVPVKRGRGRPRKNGLPPVAEAKPEPEPQAEEIEAEAEAEAEDDGLSAGDRALIEAGFKPAPASPATDRTSNLSSQVSFEFDRVANIYGAPAARQIAQKAMAGGAKFLGIDRLTSEQFPPVLAALRART